MATVVRRVDIDGHEFTVRDSDRRVLAGDWDAAWTLVRAGKLVVEHAGPGTYGHMDFALPRA